MATFLIKCYFSAFVFRQFSSFTKAFPMSQKYHIYKRHNTYMSKNKSCLLHGHKSTLTRSTFYQYSVKSFLRPLVWEDFYPRIFYCKLLAMETHCQLCFMLPWIALIYLMKHLCVFHAGQNQLSIVCFQTHSDLFSLIPPTSWLFHHQLPIFV